MTVAGKLKDCIVVFCCELGAVKRPFTWYPAGQSPPSSLVVIVYGRLLFTVEPCSGRFRCRADDANIPPTNRGCLLTLFALFFTVKNGLLPEREKEF